MLRSWSYGEFHWDELIRSRRVSFSPEQNDSSKDLYLEQLRSLGEMTY